MNRRQKITLLIIGIILILLVLIGLTYAYFVTRINGSITESVDAKTLKLELVYGENDPTIKFGDNVLPGYSVSKEFSVTNKGSSVDYFSIKMENVVNTFIRREDIIYIIEKEGEEIKRGMLPNTESWLVYKEKIEVDETIDYKITVEYLNKEEDQSEDMNKDVSFKVNIDSRIDDYFTNAKEGTLIAAIAKDNAISKPLTIPGTALPIKSYEDDGTQEVAGSDILFENFLTTYFTYSDSYIFDTDTGLYSLVNPQVGVFSDIQDELIGKYIASQIGSRNLTLENYKNLAQIYKVYKVSDLIDSDKKIIGKSVNVLRTIKLGLGPEAELSYTDDDYGNSYYYRGNVKNNYINYSGKCWRIVRVQGDGSIKLSLADLNHECQDSEYSRKNRTSGLINIGQAFNVYNPSGGKENLIYNGSSEELVVNSWGDKLDKNLLKETYWCNDITLNAQVRLNQTKEAEPSLKCNFEPFEYSLKYKSSIGILSVDELVYAGATYVAYGDGNVEIPYYLLDNNQGDGGKVLAGFWTSSALSDILYYRTYFNGNLGSWGYYLPYTGSHPVITIKNTNLIIGDGTQKNPYVIQ